METLSLSEARTYGTVAVATALTAGAGIGALAGVAAGVVVAGITASAALAGIRLRVTRPRD